MVASRTSRSGSPTMARPGVCLSPRGNGATTPPSSMSRFPARAARYVQLRGLSEVEGRPFMSAAELSIDTSRTGCGRNSPRADPIVGNLGDQVRRRRCRASLKGTTEH